MSSVQLLCAAPAYLDMTFAGLRALPTPGHEEFAAELMLTPGGGALNAIGAARLGLRTACAFPVGDDEPGRLLISDLEAQRIAVMGSPQGRTAVTVVLPYDGDRAMVTYDPEALIDPEAIAALSPERVICTLDQVEAIPDGTQAFVTVGDREATRYGRRTLPKLPPRATVLLNAREAATLTGRASAHDAARTLTEWAEVVVVTRGARGALACMAGTLVEAPGVRVDAVDTTGAGDLFAAAWVWGETRGLELEVRLQWAVLYSALSVTVVTAAAGACDLDTLLTEGRQRGLSGFWGANTVARQS